MNYAKGPEVKQLIKRVLREDIGRGDITNKSLFLKQEQVKAVILAGEGGIVCGLDIARLVFKLKDNNIKFTPRAADGDAVKKGQVLARISGQPSSILSAERVALNFLGLLSGVATRTAAFVGRVKDYKVKIMDTRKTIPGLRELQKYAVRIGGGYNHRFKLDEMVLVKDSHLRVTIGRVGVEGLKDFITKIKKKIPSGMKIEIEVENLKQLRLALKANPDIIMLDNMGVAGIRKAVRIRNEQSRKSGILRPQIEASGNIQLKNIRAYARAGVEFISLGTLTKDIHSLDLSMEIG